MTQPALQVLAKSRQPVRKAIRRLRWFIESFKQQMLEISSETGTLYEFNEQRATMLFLDWLRAFDAQKPVNPDDHRAYVGFAAGLMLRMMLKHEPITAISLPLDADRETNPAYFWPEGYVYVAYCLTVRGAVLEQDFREDLRSVPESTEIRTWWSFRENVREEPALAIAFLDMFAGDPPQWAMPDLFRANQMKRMTELIVERN